MQATLFQKHYIPLIIFARSFNNKSQSRLTKIKPLPKVCVFRVKSAIRLSSAQLCLGNYQIHRTFSAEVNATIMYLTDLLAKSESVLIRANVRIWPGQAVLGAGFKGGKEV